jgi:hypothetical protein
MVLPGDLCGCAAGIGEAGRVSKVEGNGDGLRVGMMPLPDVKAVASS